MALLGLLALLAHGSDAAVSVYTPRGPTGLRAAQECADLGSWLAYLGAGACADLGVDAAVCADLAKPDRANARCVETHGPAVSKALGDAKHRHEKELWKGTAAFTISAFNNWGVVRPFLTSLGAPRVLPSAATVFGVLVDAPALAATKFTREGRLGDHDVSALDDRADATLRDLAPAACARLPALCAPFPLLDLNLDVRSASVAEEAARAVVASAPPASAPGAAHALLFWWHLRYGGEHGAVAETVSTAPALDGGETGDGHWRVAGVVLDRGRGLPLARGDVLDVHLAVRGSKVGVLKTVTRRAKDGGAAATRPA